MKHLFGSYAIFFNQKHERKGHVFCGPFRAMVCTDEKYLLAASLYIHLNAFKAGLCKTIADYKWHSLRYYLTDSKSDGIVQSDFVLSKIHEDRIRACQEYRKMLQTASERLVMPGKAVKDIPKAIRAYIPKAKPALDKAILSAFPRKTLTEGRRKRILFLGRYVELSARGLARE